MNIIDSKLINAYAVLVLSTDYILRESERTAVQQRIVPNKYVEATEVAVAERIIEGLGPVETEGELILPVKANFQSRIENLEEAIDVLLEQ